MRIKARSPTVVGTAFDAAVDAAVDAPFEAAAQPQRDEAGSSTRMGAVGHAHPVNHMQRRIGESPLMVTQRRSVSFLRNSASTLHPADPPAVVQAVSFTRFGSSLRWTAAERAIDDKERQVRGFLQDMAPNAKRFPKIAEIGVELDGIRDTPIPAERMQATMDRLRELHGMLDDISSHIASVGMRSGDDVMKAYGANAPDSKAGRIIDLILSTISLLPPTFQTRENNDAIAQALHPDIRNMGIGLHEEWLGESDVKLATARRTQVLSNLHALEQRILNDWPLLQRKFKLAGQLAHLHLTGSDLHRGAQQVVIIESSGGQKAVYKPRSVAPDAALLDSQSSAFAELNKLGASLPTMDFQQVSDDAGYAEFVSRIAKKSEAEIQEYYRQMGQLSVAAKLFGVNDLHYENIMAAGRGPTVIDAETSMLPNVITADGHEATELDAALSRHVSQIDDKLTNNAFYTDAEETEWQALPEEERENWDLFVGKKRSQDVADNGPYAGNMMKGISEMMDIIKRNRKQVETLATSAFERSEHVRVVPVGTAVFKGQMSTYRDVLRNGADEEGVQSFLESCATTVVESLQRKGYTLHNKRAVVPRIAEDFERGDIPVLHYAARTDKLTWNDRVVGRFGDSRKRKDLVHANVKQISRQTAAQVMESLR